MKICKKCKKYKELNNFYIHNQMKDGRLNICKECVKARIHNYWKDGRGKMVDSKRNQDPSRKEWQRLYSYNQREKHAAKRKVQSVWWTWFKKNKGVKSNCEVCGSGQKIEAHHSDYNKPYDVMWLCCKHHKGWHRENKPILPF